jgi:energy-coupling factor transporter ATP-binding protein EcfA2
LIASASTQQLEPVASERNVQYISFVLQGRPLYDNAADEPYFVVPREWDRLVRAIARRLNGLIIGPRGIGKTTLLHQVQRTLRDDGKHVVFVDGTAVADSTELMSRLRDGLVGRPGIGQSLALTAGLTALTGDPNPPAAAASRAFYNALLSLSEAEPAVVLVDASSSAEAVYGLFGRMRDTVWQLPHTWVVAVDDSDRATALKPPADAFFDAVIQLEPPSTKELGELLARRAPDVAPETLGRVAAHASGNPRAALRALNDAAIHDRDPAQGLTARAKLLDQASALGRPHGMLMAELLDRGQASPSDELLQRTLGVTRARLTILLRQMLREGVVVADTEKPEGPGRPRTIYRPALGGS